MIAHAIASCDGINTGIWLGEFSRDRVVSFAARPEQDFTGIAMLVASRDERLTLRLAAVWLAHVQSNMI